MSDCFFNPDAPGCGPEEEPKDDAMMDENAEEWAEVEAWVEENSSDLMEAQLAYLWVSGAIGVTALLELFVYKWAIIIDGTDADGDAEDQVYNFAWDYGMRNAEYIDTMYNMQAEAVLAYGSLAIMGTAMITQLLSILGMAVGINQMVWWYGVMLGGSIVHGIAGLIWMRAINMGWQACNTAYETPDDLDSDEVTECSSWDTYNTIMLWNMKRMVAQDTAVTLALGHYMENWMIAQWWAMPEEERYEMWLEKKDDHEEMFAKLH